MRNKTISTSSIVLTLAITFLLTAIIIPSLFAPHSTLLAGILALSHTIAVWGTSTTILHGHGVSDSFSNWVALAAMSGPLVTVIMVAVVAKVRYAAKSKKMIINHVSAR